MQITTQSGFTCEIDPKVLDNMELVDALADVQGDNPLAYSTVSRLVLGKETRAKLYDHLRTADGRVPASAVSEEIRQIFDAFGKAGKNC